MIWVAYRRSVDEAAELVDNIESLLESDITSEVILGGQAVGEDLGYGPARLLDPERVRAVASTLRALPVEELRRRVDLRAMSAADLYPDIWDETEVFDEYLAPAYGELCAFYADAARDDQAVIQTIC